MWPSAPKPAGQFTGPEKVTGTIVRVNLKPCPQQAVPPGEPSSAGQPGQGGAPATDPRRCGTAQIQLTSGPLSGRAVTAELPSGPGNRVFTAGDDVIVMEMHDDGAGRPSYQLSDHTS